MDHRDHVALIRDGVSGGGRWLELGAGRGAFTLALADLLGPAADCTAVDRDGGDLRHLANVMAERFPAARLQTVMADFAAPRAFDGPSFAGVPFDGLLVANALHFVPDPAAVLHAVWPRLRAGATVIVVEYDADSGNPWVPYPFSFRSWEAIAEAAGLEDTRLIGRVPSRFLAAIYAAASRVPAAAQSATGPDD
jgi:ubiquinone/menaquinone biosynthesis C-methylase UbiE